jgi:galactoside O-acetyltransferase
MGRGVKEVFKGMKVLRYLKAFIAEFWKWFEYIINNTPGGIGLRLRDHYWSWRLSCSGLFFMPGIKISGRRNIFLKGDIFLGYGCHLAVDNGMLTIGRGTSMNDNAMLCAGGGEIHIGDNVLIGPNVVIRSSNHRYGSNKLTIKQQGHEEGKIVIEDNVWIGANAVILPNVRIGSGSVIGAGAVVTRDIPQECLAVGVPAKVKKTNIGK